jgi:multiple sugar transport system permease protein
LARNGPDRDPKKIKALGHSVFLHFDRKIHIYFLTPAFIFTILLLAFPIFISIYYSFTNKNLLGKPLKMVGWSNYAKVLGDPTFLVAMKNTILYTGLSLTGQLLLGLVIALALNRINRFKGFFRTLILVPWAFPMIAVALTWTYLLNDFYGIINAWLMKWGWVSEPVLFLSNPSWAIITVACINIWFGTPLFAVNILASLQSIPRDIYEAAHIDGAGVFNVFYHITLPYIKVVIGLLLILRTIWIFNTFDLVYLLTGGGPGSATTTVSIYAYRVGWTLHSLGRSSAVTIVLLVFLLIVAFFYFKVLDKWEKEVY